MNFTPEDDPELAAFARSLIPPTRADKLQGSLDAALNFDPNEYAKAIKISAKTGVIPTAVMRDQAYFDRSTNTKKLSAEELFRFNPKVAAWLVANQDNAIVAHDDVESLTKVEDAVPTVRAAQPETWRDVMSKFWRSAMEGTLFSSEDEAKAIRNSNAARILTARRMGQDPATFHTGDASTLPISRINLGIVRGVVRGFSDSIRYVERKVGVDTGIGDLTKGWVKSMLPPNPTIADTGSENLGSTVSLLLPGMALGKGVGLIGKIPALARFPRAIQALGPWASAAAMAAPEAAAEAQNAYDENIAKGMSETEANSRADRVFWGNIALLTVTNKVGWFSKGGALRAAVSEGVQEGGQQIMGNLATDRQITEGVLESAAWGAGLGGGLPIVGGLFGGIFKTRRMGAGVQPVSNYTQDFMNSLATSAQESKLLQRSEEKFIEANQAIFADGPHENLLMPVDAFETYYQSRNIDPAEKARELNIKNYLEAKLSGADLEIPTAYYQAKVAGTADHVELSKDVRLFEGQLTQREEEAAKQSGGEVAALAREVDAETVETPEFKAIFDDLVQRYQKAGESKAVAETYAMDGAKVYTGMARAAGLNASELYAQYAPQVVKGEAPSRQEILQEAFTPETFPAEGVSWWEDNQLYFQSAYHGSPYRFDKFSLEHIGKGEGAQVYGWGLYFASNREVADYYRKTLGANQYSYDGQTLSDGSPIATAAEILYAAQGDIEMARDDVGAMGLMSSTKRKVLSELGKLDYTKIKQGGQLYQVEIPEDDSYLLWDKPLSEHPKTIIKSLSEINYSIIKEMLQPIELGSTTGMSIYSALSREVGVENASKMLHSVGISGIKYLDVNSRSSGDGDYNYVVFDDSAVKIAKTFYQSAYAGGIQGAGDNARYNKTIGMTFGSKEWREHYKEAMSRKRNESMDRAKAALERSNTPQGQQEFDYERNQQAMKEAEDFARFEAAMDRVVIPRGWFQPQADGTFVIGKTPQGDFSTFIHEPAHVYLEMFADLAGRETASEKLKEDWGKVLEFLGVSAYEQIGEYEHEKWARANEAYAREGKAPSEDLRPVFQRFKVWLQSIYRRMTELDVELSDDIRGVFDRMRATDEEIETAHQLIAGPRIFKTAEEAGWTDKQFREYAIDHDLAIEDAKEEILKKLNAAAVREQTATWKAEEREVRAAIEAMVDDSPEFKAIRQLRKGEMVDGTPLTLNKEAMVKQFGEDRVKALQAKHPGLYRVDGDLDAQTAAEILGFESGEDLMLTLEETGKRSNAIEEGTRRVMTERHGDIRYDGTIEDQARQAVVNDRHAKTLHRELVALQKKLATAQEKIGQSKADSKEAVKEAVGEVKGQVAAKDAARRSAVAGALDVPPLQTFREAARDLIEQRAIWKLDANSYLNNMRKYSRESYKKALQGKYDEAAGAKNKELLSHFLYLEAVKAKQEAGKIAAYAKKLAKPSMQGRIAEANTGDLVDVDRGFLAQINAFLTRYEFREATNREIERTQTLMEFVKELEAQGEELDIDPELLAERPKNYREMTITELRAVNDALKQLVTMARHQRQFLVDGRKETWEQIRKIFLEWTPAEEKSIVHRQGDKLTFGETAGHLLRGVDAELQKVEWMTDRFDRGDINGPMRTFIKQIIDNAQGRRLDLGADIFERIMKLSDARDPAEVRKEMDLTGIKFPSQTREMTYRQLISWALNLGNMENRNVALIGEGLVDGEGNLSPLVDQAMSKLSSKQWEFIQGVWDVAEVLKPLIREKELRTKGIEPKWKEDTPFQVTTSDGKTMQLRGGYYPLAGDKNTTDIGRMQADPVSSMGQGKMFKPTPASGFTKTVTGATYHLSLDYPTVLSGHLRDVITNVTMGEAVKAVNKLIEDPDVRTALSEKLGPEYVNTLKPWLFDVVDASQSENRLRETESLLTRFKSGAVIATLAGSVPIVLVQISDIAKPIFAPGISNVELVKAYASMMKDGKELVQMIREKSPNVMRHRAENFNRDMADTLQSWGMFDQKKRKTTKFLMSAFSVMDAAVTFPTWLAVYRKGLLTHGIESQAITEADAVINRTFQAGDQVNMSAMFRNRNIWMRLFTTFQNDGNTWYGIVSSSVASKKIGRISMALMGIFIGQALGQMLKNRGWGDDADDEEKKQWLIKQAVLAPVGSVPILGDAIATGTKVRTGDSGDFVTSAMGRSFGSFVKPFVHWDDMDWQDVAISEADALGVWAGIPGTAQALRSWKYVHKVQTGKEQPESTYEAIKNTILGPPPKKK